MTLIRSIHFDSQINLKDFPDFAEEINKITANCSKNKIILPKDYTEIEQNLWEDLDDPNFGPVIHLN